VGSKITTFCSMIGNPSFYGERFQDYSLENINKLKETGVNTVLVNLAWSRPHIDAVNLEHLVVSESFPLLSDMNDVRKYQKLTNSRIDNVKACGLKAIGLFGIPRYLDYAQLPEEYAVLKGATDSTIDQTSQVTCLMSEATMALYKELIRNLLEHYPQLDGMLVYTYDEIAEVCDEDSDCPRCGGIPAEDRIPPFLNALNRYARSLKPAFELWWEPWELAASQVYACMKTLDLDIAIACHSTLHEVYMANQPDIWLRNISYLAKEQGRNFIVEMFLSGSGEDLGPIAGYPSPRLIYEQIRGLDTLEGITGIKEYYGCAVQYMGINEKVLSKALSSQEDYEQLLDGLLTEYTTDPVKAQQLKDMWGYASFAVRMVPWDTSWSLRMYNYHPYDTAYWGKVSFGNLMRTPWNTPSWLSNRRSYYLVVDSTHNMTGALQRDILKRFDLAVEYLDKGLRLAGQLDIENEELCRQEEAMRLLKYFIICRRNHLELSMLAEQLRKDPESDAVSGIKQVLESELENARQMIGLVEQSDIPYYIEPEKIGAGMQEVIRCKEALADIETWKETYKEL
jgi:hypothetical protein